jgi:hypothetical protein
VSVIGIIVSFITRTFNEDSEYTIPAEVVEKMEEAQAKKIKELRHEANENEEEMGLLDFIKFVAMWAFGLVKGILGGKR